MFGPPTEWKENLCKSPPGGMEAALQVRSIKSRPCVVSSLTQDLHQRDQISQIEEWFTTKVRGTPGFIMTAELMHMCNLAMDRISGLPPQDRDARSMHVVPRSRLQHQQQ